MLLVADCKDLADCICDYQDGALPQAQKQALDLHLAACPACRESFKAYRAMSGLLGQSLAAAGAAGLHPASGTNLAAVTSGAHLAVPTEEVEEEAGEPIAGRTFLAVLLAQLGALPWWVVSGALHASVLGLAVLITAVVFNQKVDDRVIVTNLVKPVPKAEEKEPLKPQDVLRETLKEKVSDVVLPDLPTVQLVSDDIADVEVQVEHEAAVEAGETGLDSDFFGDEGNRSGIGLGGGDLGARLGGGVPLPGGGRGMVGTIGGVPFAGQQMTLIFDNSLSMKAVVEFAKQAVVEFLAEARGKGTVDFYCEINQIPAHQFHKMKSVPLRASQEKVLTWFEGMPGGGGDRLDQAASSVWWAFEAAMQEYPDMIVFVTDWKLHSPNKEYNWQRQTEEIKKLLADGKAPKLVFFTQNTGGAQFAVMKELAELTGGTVKVIEGKPKKK